MNTNNNPECRPYSEEIVDGRLARNPNSFACFKEGDMTFNAIDNLYEGKACLEVNMDGSKIVHAINLDVLL